MLYLPVKVKSPACINTSPSGIVIAWCLQCVSDKHTIRNLPRIEAGSDPSKEPSYNLGIATPVNVR